MSGNVSLISEKVSPMIHREFFYQPLQAGRPEDDVVVVIDGANLSQISRGILRKSIDYHKLNLMFRENYPGLRSIEFIVTEYLTENNPNDNSGRRYPNGFSQIRALLTYLQNNRYKVISRAVNVDNTAPGFNSDADPEHQMDVEITSAVYKAARYANHIVFVGGSQKYVTPLRDLREQGKTITVLGIKKPDPNEENRPISIRARYTADELRAIDNFVDFSDKDFPDVWKPIRKSYSPVQDNTVEMTEEKSNLEHS